jgi:hypothetical protein
MYARPSTNISRDVRLGKALDDSERLAIGCYYLASDLLEASRSGNLIDPDQAKFLSNRLVILANQIQLSIEDIRKFEADAG